MDEKQKTIADIVTEKRREADELEASSYRPYSFLRERIAELRQEADRIEAAQKRERDSIHRAMVLIAGIEMEGSEDPPKLWTALEDAYDALSDALGTDGDATADMAEAEATGRHFVVKSSRNGAKMREALVNTLDALKSLSKSHSTDLPEDVRALLGGMAFTVNAALAEPRRNCDVGDADDWEKRFGEECDKGHTCSACPVRHAKTKMAIEFNKGARCEFIWAQMPYEEGGER